MRALSRAVHLCFSRDGQSSSVQARVRAMTYEQSTIDWARLRAYAKKVAHETRAPRGTNIVTETKIVEDVSYGFFGRRKVSRREVSIENQVLVDYWVLDSASFRQTWKGKYSTSFHERTMFALRTDGELVVLSESWEDGEGIVNDRFSYNSHAKTFTERAFVEPDITRFDYAREPHRSQGKVEVWSTGNPSTKRLTHAKGVGLSIRLKQLLEGR